VKRHPDSTATPFDRDVWRSEMGKWDGWDAIAPEPSMLPETARANGYKTAQECAQKWGWSRGGAKVRLAKEYENGTLERVRLAGSRAYAYRPKQDKGERR